MKTSTEHLIDKVEEMKNKFMKNSNN